MNKEQGYVSFDIETLGSDPAHPDGITCAATMLVVGNVRQNAVRWHGPLIDEKYADTMLPANCQKLAEYLYRKMKQGYPPAGWNTVGFDFRVLADYCKSDSHHTMSVELALGGYDPMYQMVNEKGFGAKLKNVAIGMEVVGKLEGMDGATAAASWCKDRETQEIVLDYVEQDVVAFANVWEAIIRFGGLRWLTGSGNISTWIPRVGWELAGEIVGRRQKNISKWASPELVEVFKQSKFTSWF